MKIMRLSLLLGACFLSFLSYGQLESSFFQENQIYYNPAALPANINFEALAGAKLSSFRYFHPANKFYQATAFRINRLSFTATAAYLSDQVLREVDVSLSGAYTIYQKDKTFLSAGFGIQFYTIKFKSHYYYSFPQPEDDPGFYHGWGRGRFPGLKGGLFFESGSFQAGIAGYLHGFAEELVFHSQYIAKIHSRWAFRPGIQLVNYAPGLDVFKDRRAWIFNAQASLVYNGLVALGGGYRYHPFFSGLFILGSLDIADRFNLGFSTDVFLAGPVKRRNHELFLKFRINKEG